MTTIDKKGQGMHHYTQDALDRLDTRILEAEEKLKEALLSMGSGAEADNNTWHDNPAFEQAKTDVDQATGHLSKLRELRRNATVVERTDTKGVEVGSTVTFENSDGEQLIVAIGGHFVARSAHKDQEVMEISTSSPIGAALLYQHPGDEVKYTTPNGKQHSVTILEVK